MERNYTEGIRNGFYDIIEKDTVAIWKDLDKSPKMILSGNWKSHYQEVVARYRLSSRFAFMRILFEKATGLPPAKVDDKTLANGFYVDGIGKFPGITIDHAENMSESELKLYKKLMLNRVKDNELDCCTEAEGLINHALELPSQGEKSKLSRDEIIKLGHLVNFSLDDMQFILLRVLGDNDAGFKYSSSMDLIDLYGFVIPEVKLDEIDELKRWYCNAANNIRKLDYEDKPANCTQDIADSLVNTFKSWAAETRTDAFKIWLCQKAPTLDLKSKTARKVYINLAAYACALFDGKPSNMYNDTLGRDFYDDMEYISVIDGYADYAIKCFFEASKPDLSKCEEFASRLIYENAEYANDFHTHDKDAELLYHRPYVEKGTVTVRGKLNKGSKQRIVDILMDEATPVKSDLLSLLWVVANSHWIGQTSSDTEKAIFLDDFLAAASCLLTAALLPDFYPPNVLEETLLFSIVLGDEDQTPATVYESICSTFTKKGTTLRPKGSTNKTLEQKREIAEYYFAHEAEYPTKTACKEACAKRFGVGIASVEGYCRDYKKGKYN